ncbi:MAG: hydroxymethylbilane synthase [Myxococcota bacterium]|nr:hydroxymethylbilane synthase [Myxococcota bacterium]
MSKKCISTRESPLALWQAEHVAQLMREAQLGLEVSLLGMTTKGDRILDKALSKVGGKDLFVKEIENALLDGRAQVAVHSLKDVPTTLPDGLVITAYPKREDPRDALVSPQGFTFETLPKGARIGTSSLRRAAQFLHHRPDLEIVPIRGNVQTRIRRMKEENMHGTILAYAGLKRLRMEEFVSEIISQEMCLPAVGQGILAVETRIDDDDTNAIVSALDDRDTRACAECERGFLAKLEGGCQVPIAGHATVDGSEIHLKGLVASLDGKTIYRAESKGPVSDALSVGISVANIVLEQGADNVLASLKDK